MVVLAVNDGVIGLIATAFHFPCADESRIDRVLKLSDHHEVIQRDNLLFVCFRTEEYQFSHLVLSGLGDLLHQPLTLISLFLGTTLGKNPNFVPLADGPLRQRNRLGAMTLEVQPE